MDRGIACGNKICARREEQRRHELHRSRIRSMKPLVDTTAPEAVTMDHVRNNLKKEQLLEERYSEIDRENRILLSKMSDIMKKQTFEKAPGHFPGPVSLNRDFRKKELLKITRENQTILKRIQQAQPIYNHVAWEGNHRQNRKYLENSSEYPLIIKTRRGVGASSELTPLDDIREDATGNAQQQSTAVPGMSSQQLIEKPGEEDVRYVLKEGKRIGETYFLVEMSTDGRSLTISAYDGDSQSTMELVVKEKNHRKLYRETNGDYSLVASRLRLDGNRLVLDDGSGGAVSSAPISSTYTGRQGGEMDADAMVAYAKSGSAGSVNAQIDLSASGEAQLRLRGLTPSSVGKTPSPEPM